MLYSFMSNYGGQRLLSGCGAWASHCSGFSCCGAQALGAWASVVAVCGISSCGLEGSRVGLSSCIAGA